MNCVMKINLLVKKIKHKFFCRTAEKNADWYKNYTDIHMGENCRIFPSVSMGSEPYLITIGNNVEITDGVRILTHDGGVKVAMELSLCENVDLMGRVVIGNNVFIGINTIILPGVEIGDNVIIGAGSIVTKNILSNTVACGVPARALCSIEEYYTKNKYRIFETDHLSYEDKKQFLQKYL